MVVSTRYSLPFHSPFFSFLFFSFLFFSFSFFLLLFMGISYQGFYPSLHLWSRRSFAYRYSLAPHHSRALMGTSDELD